MQNTIAALEARLAAATSGQDRLAALNALAWSLRGVDPHRAYTLCAESVKTARECGDPAALAVGLGMSAACAIILGQYEDAAAALDEGLPLSRSVGNLAAEAHCLHSLGALHYTRAEHAGATEKTMEALQIREDLEDWEGVGAGYNLLGNIQFALCEYGQALDWYTRSLEVRERAGDLYGIGVSLDNIGNIYGERGEFLEAAKYHQRGLDHAVRIGSPVLEVKLLCNLGSDYADLGRHEEGIEIGRRTIARATAMENWYTVAFALTNVAHSLAKTSRQAEAVDCYTRAIETAQMIGDRKVEAHARYSIGDLLANDGKLDDARRFLADSFVLASAIGARRTAFLAAQTLSEVCKRLGDYAAALGHHETFHRLEKEVFTEEAEDRAKSLVIKMEVEHHRREAESLQEINAALQEANARLEALATTDPLTCLPNHRTIAAALDLQAVRARREGLSYALLFLDIDHFKSVNDTYGHPVGDSVLQEFTKRVSSCLREEDMLGRWGGEEFLVLLPGTDLEGALLAGERIRAAVAAHPLTVQAGLFQGELCLTCSLGAAASPPQEGARDALVQAADRALYAAKRMGRNQVRGADDPAASALEGPLFPGRWNHDRSSVRSHSHPRSATSQV